MIPVPNGYDAILTKQYGDYMKPAKVPALHDNNIIWDVERPYKIVLNELKSKE